MSNAVLVQHSQGCKGGPHSDAAKRVSDQYRLHRAALGTAAIGKFLAVRLADGTSDGVLYDSKPDAIRHQHHNEAYYAFVCINAGDMGVCEAEGYMEAMRLLYDGGAPRPDRDHRAGGLEVIPRVTREDQSSLLRSIRNRGRTRPGGLVYPGE